LPSEEASIEPAAQFATIDARLATNSMAIRRSAAGVPRRR
jgi:hypothetical protein